MEQPAEVLVQEEPALRLRRWRAADAGTVERIVAEAREHLRPWLPWAAEHGSAAAQEFAERAERQWASNEAYHYAVLAEGQEVGSVSLMRRIGDGGLEIGYWIHPASTRRGLGRGAAATVLREAFTLPGTERVEIHHDAANAASGAIPRSLGFTEVDRRPDDGPSAPGESGVTVVWRMTRAQYLARRGGLEPR